MDVTLPNGLVVYGVPEGTSKKDLAEKLIRNNIATADELGFDPFEDERTASGQAFETAKGIGRGFANAFLSAGEGLAELADAGTNAIGLEELIDSGDENDLVRAAREGRAAVDEAMGADLAYRDQWLTKFGEGVGSFASFFTPAGAIKLAGMAGKGISAAKAAKVAEIGATGALAVGTGAGDQAQRIQAARDSGLEVSEDEEDLSVLLGGGVGLSELIVPQRLLNRLRGLEAGNKLPSGIKERLSSALRTGSVEGIQEVAASIAQDGIERGVYNEALEINGGSLMDDFTIGGAVGAGADLVINAVAGRRNKGAFQAAEEAEGKLREDLQDAQDARQRLLSGDLAIQERIDAEAALDRQAANEARRAAGEAPIDPSQIAPPTGRALTSKLKTPSRIVSVTAPNGESFQAEEKTRVRNKGKPTESVTTYIEAPGGGEVITSVNGVPQQSGFQITTVAQPTEGIQRRYPKQPMLAYAQSIRQTMGDNFPSADNTFTVKLPEDFGGVGASTTQLDAQGVPVFTVQDSNGQQYGVPLQNSEDAFALAGFLNDEMINDNVFSGGDAVITSSPESYDADQESSLQAYNFAANHPDSNTYSSVAVDSAAETTQDRGFDETADVKVLMQDRVGPTKMTASQRINAKRLRQGLPVTNTFTIQEVRSVLKEDQLYNLSDTRVNGLPETETYRAGLSKNNNPIVKSSAGEILQGRPLTTLEKDAAIKANPKKKPPKLVKFKTEADARVYANQLNNRTGKAAVEKGVMRNVDANFQEMEQLLKAKNITSKVGSPEIKYLAGRILGKKTIKSVNDLSLAESRLLYQKLRSLPRFDKPTKLPTFKLPKYTGAQFRAASKTLQENPNAGEVVLANATGINPTTQQGAAALSDLKADLAKQGVQAAPAVEAEPVVEQEAEVLALPAPAVNVDRLRKAITKTMKGFGLKDVGLSLDYALRTAVKDANGNLVYGIRPRQGGDIDSMVVGGESVTLDPSREKTQLVRSDEIDPEGRAEAYYDPTINTIFLSIDKVMADPSMTEAQVEAALLEILDHEMIHAMRKLDLFTNKEWSLLSRAAANKKMPDGKTFLKWAQDNYSDLSPVDQVEESVAELVRAARKDPKLLQGKPRSLVERIARFFRNMVSSLKGEEFNTFSEVIGGIESGAIGARERGQIRTLAQTQKRASRRLKTLQDKGAVVTTGEDAERPVPTATGQTIADFDEAPASSRVPIEAEMGINVRTDGDTNYAELIVSGQKKYETRDKDSLRPYVGKRIGIVETGSGPAKLVGYATVGEPIEVGEAEFADSRDQHLVPEGSKFDIKPGQSKFLYEMIDPEQLAQPIDASATKGIVARNISQLGGEAAPATDPDFAESPVFSREEGLTNEQVRAYIDSSPITQQFLDPKEVDQQFRDAVDPASRSTVVMMTPNEFLNLAMTGTEFSKTERVQEMFDAGERFQPNFLQFKANRRGAATIAGHEGRHRSRLYRDQGYGDTLMPVTLTSIGGEAGELRFGEKDARPRVLYKEDDRRLVGLTSESRVRDPDEKLRALEPFQLEFPKTIPFDLEGFAEDGTPVFKTKPLLADKDYDGPVFSRRPLSPMGEAERLGMTNTDLLPTSEELEQMKNNTYKPEKKRTLAEAAQFLQDRWEAATGRTEPFEYTEENIGILSDMLATEAMVALEKDGNAIGWYDRKIKAAKEVMKVVEPRIMQSPETEAVFDFVLAVTSNGQAVVDNFEMATDMFRFYMDKGRLPKNKKEFNKGGERNNAMLEAFNFHNAYEASGQNMRVADFLDADFTVNELRDMAKAFNNEVGFEAIKVPGAEGVDVQVKGSYILGPKIGQGFYQNIRGNYDPLTMDIWWMRMWNRAVGRPFAAPPDLAKARGELIPMIDKVGGLPRTIIKDALEGSDQPYSEIVKDPYLFDEFIQSVERRYQRYFKDYKKEHGVNHVKPEIFKKTGTFVKNLKKQLQATPKSGSERQYMREVTAAARERLSEAGYDITTADFQALMWYPEKQLFRALGVQPGRGSDNDYLDAAEILAEKEGVPRGQVEKALRDADRQRAVDSRSGARGQDGSVRQDDSGFDAEESPAFSRRPENLAKEVIGQSEVDRVVEDNLQVAENRPVSTVPRFNPGADPYAQAVAANPDKGQEVPASEMPAFSRANAPIINPLDQAAVDNVVAELPTNTPGQTYLNVLDQGPIALSLTRLKQKAINRYAQLENYQGALGNLLADSSSIAAALMADRSNAITAAALQYGVPVYTGGMTKIVDFEHTNSRGETQKIGGLIDLMSMLYTKEHGSLEQLAQAYSIAKRAERLKAKGIDVPGTPADHAANIATAESFLDENGNSIIKDWYDAWQDYNGYTVQFLQDTGVVDPETAEMWRDQSDYIPFYRQVEGAETPNAPNIFGGLTGSADLKAIKGSKKEINVPMLEAISMNLNAAISMGMKNVAQQRIVRDMRNLGLAREVKPGQRTTGEAVVTFKVDGNRRNFIIDDPLIYESLTVEPAGGFEQFISKTAGVPARFLREMVTREPGFVIANMLRDSLSAFVTSGSKFTPVIDTIFGYAEGMEKLERTGVVGGYDYKNDPENIGEYAGKILQKRNKNVKQRDPISKLFIGAWDVMGQATTRSDAATRNAVYKDVLARTGNEAEASFQAMEVLNFGRRGSNVGMRILTATIPFLNARLQGLDVLYRGLSGKSSANRELSRGQAARSAFARGSLIAASTAIYYAMFSDDEQYKEQTEEVKDNYWIIPTASGVPVRVPIPFEVGLLFKTLPERIIDSYNEGTTPREAQQSVQRAVFGTLGIQPPQAITPLIEAYMNYDLYTGRPVTPVFIEGNLDPQFQELASTSEIAKNMSKVVGISPIKIDHLMNGYGGTIGMYFLGGLDYVLRDSYVQGDNRAVLAGKDVSQYPIIRRFFGSEFGGGAKEDFYEMWDYIKRVEQTTKKLYEDGRTDELESYLVNNRQFLGLKSQLQPTATALSDLRNQRRTILKADLTAAQKQEAIKLINEQERYYLQIVPQLERYIQLPTIAEKVADRLSSLL